MLFTVPASIKKHVQQRIALDNMFDAPDNMLREEDYLEMISYLRYSIRSKTDGYVGG